MSQLLSVEKALALILEGAEPTQSEHVSLEQSGNRVLSADLIAKRTQPPFPASAMDGYAVRGSDIQHLPSKLNQIGESAAGHGFHGGVSEGECVRIFTGAPVPEGSDTIIIQENTETDGSEVTVLKGEQVGRYIRPAGLDFSEGETLLQQGHVLNPNTISLAAAMNHPALPVHHKPKVAIIATGDELLLPGSTLGPDQIIASNGFGVAEIVRNAGGEPIDLGIATDTLSSLDEKYSAAEGADIVISLGGASVGDHDLVRQALENRGVDLDFWKLAMRPGKPVMFGKSGATRYLGLPGNPVSSLVCALVFVVPLIRKLTNLPPQMPRTPARLNIALDENDQREEYMRATYEHKDGQYWVTPFDKQDSSILSLMAKANCLLVRPAFAEKSNIGEACEILIL